MTSFSTRDQVTRFALAALAVGLSGPARATVLDPVTQDDLVRDAELIFQGVVVDIEYRESEVRTKDQERLPHTFVTFQIEDILMGSVAATSSVVTLRFQGGRDAKGRFLALGECPLFDVGDRDILFVRRNGNHVCPVVGWRQGRFRIIDGELFGDEGQEVWLTAEQTLAYGDVHDKTEVLTHFGASLVKQQLVRDTSPPEEPPDPPQPNSGTWASPTQFRVFFASLIPMLRTPTELASLPPVSNADSSRPFFVQRLQPVRPPGERRAPRRSVTRQTGLDRAEESLLRATGNPVLNKKRPPRGKKP